MLLAKYEQMYNGLKEQERLFNEYWTALRGGIQDFCSKVHVRMEYPNTPYASKAGKAERWVSLAQYHGTEEVSAFDLVREGSEDGYVKFFIRLILASQNEVSTYGKFYYGYKIRRINSKIELVSLDRPDEVFYLDVEQGLESAAEHLINAMQKELSETPASTWGL